MKHLRFVLILLLILIPSLSMAGTGILEVSSNPSGVKIYIDDIYVGTTPYQNFELSTGRHKIKAFLNNNYPAQYRDVVIDEVTPREVIFSFVGSKGSFTGTEIEQKVEKHTGNVTFASIPSGAIVYIDGERMKPTPVGYRGTGVGPYSVRFNLNGRQLTGNFIIYKDETTQIIADFNRNRIINKKEDARKVANIERGERERRDAYAGRIEQERRDNEARRAENAHRAAVAKQNQDAKGNYDFIIGAEKETDVGNDIISLWEYFAEMYPNYSPGVKRLNYVKQNYRGIYRVKGVWYNQAEFNRMKKILDKHKYEYASYAINEIVNKVKAINISQFNECIKSLKNSRKKLLSAIVGHPLSIRVKKRTSRCEIRIVKNNRTLDISGSARKSGLLSSKHAYGKFVGKFQMDIIIPEKAMPIDAMKHKYDE